MNWNVYDYEESPYILNSKKSRAKLLSNVMIISDGNLPMYDTKLSITELVGGVKTEGHCTVTISFVIWTG